MEGQGFIMTEILLRPKLLISHARDAERASRILEKAVEIYSQARNGDKRAAQQRVMQMIFPEDLNGNEWVTEPEPVQADGFEWIN